MFTYKKRAFKADSPKDTGDSDDDFFDSSNSRRSKVHKKETASKPAAAAPAPKKYEINLDDSNSDGENGEDGDESNIQKEAKSAVAKLLSKSTGSISPTALKTRSRTSSEKKHDIKESEAVSNAKEYLLRIGKVKEKFVGAEKKKVVGAQNDIVIDLDNEDDDIGLLLPSVTRTAAHVLDNTAIDLADDFMRAPVFDGPSIKLKTRLNGGHEWKFKISTRDTFSKLREKLGKIYGVNPSMLKLKFDGEVLNDDETPEDADMEDGYMIDVTIPKEKYDAAVAAAKKFKDSTGAAAAAGGGSASSGRSTASAGGAYASGSAGGGPQVKLTIRLNGEHELKLKLGRRDFFKKLREELGRMYGLKNTSILELKFDGDSLRDQQTPDQLSMEDDDMIDVTIPKEQFPAALAAVAKNSKA